MENPLRLVSITDLSRHLPRRSLVAMKLRPVHLRDHPMRRVKRRRMMMMRLLFRLLRSARPKLRPPPPLRRPRPSQWVTKRQRGISSLVVSLTTSMKNGSLANSRALESCLPFASLLIVTLAVPKGNSISTIMV